MQKQHNQPPQTAINPLHGGFFVSAPIPQVFYVNYGNLHGFYVELTNSLLHILQEKSVNYPILHKFYVD